ncbi:S41 family peptidase [Sphingomonas sp. HITSZ_GF]|uniref:S41 family peptidase n=1 Tax=Sphingomonas sp. HITSZ_GF TaxID=3037247 RepID=UPI00240E5A71|nr:S41 family peptidase [Sphingomonas sp. HITSZ_GF]MDG2532580.1 S41 family peptidase [Sphingomonas sp. HITSZ_GF]
MRHFLFAMSLAASPPAMAQATAPRATVEAVAHAIEEHYFDPAAAAKIATRLRADARAGRFDKLTPPQLAARLTAGLGAIDRHFAVHWRPDADDAGSRPGEPFYGPEEQERRAGYGFRRVEILPGNIAYIDLRLFAAIDFGNAKWPATLAAGNALGLVSKADALIVDLRRNNGGDPGMVGYLVSALIGPDRDVYNVFHARGQTQSERPPRPFTGEALQMPVYILTSRRTGSAAESFAYTLQAAKRAIVIGQPSAGGANPGDAVALKGGFSVFISNATPINPITNANWEGVGVQPDTQVEDADTLAIAQRRALEDAMPRLPAAEKIEAARVLETLRAPSGPAPDTIAALAGLYGTYRFIARAGTLYLIGATGTETPLGWLGADRFYPAGDPTTRYTFLRGTNGRGSALTIEWIDGDRREASRSD